MAEVLVDPVVRVRLDDADDDRDDLDIIAIQETTAGDRATSSSKKKKKIINRRTAAVRKMPVTEDIDGDLDLYLDILGSIEPCLCPPPAAGDDPPGVAFMSLDISWPPEHHLLRGPCVGYVRARHESCFLLGVAASCGGANLNTPFFLVYDTSANSVAIVPPPADYGVGSVFALQRCSGGGSDDYVLAQICLHIDFETRLRTNIGTLLTWRGSLGSRPAAAAGQWIVEEEAVRLPLPLGKYISDLACSFNADTAFAIGAAAFCWADLVEGLLIYRVGGRRFHFIPLPEDCVSWRSYESAKGYRYMCCVQRRRRQGGGLEDDEEIVKFASIETGHVEKEEEDEDDDDEDEDDVAPLSEVTLTTWTLARPLHPDGWAWSKDGAPFRMGDLYEHPVYKDQLKLRPLPPCNPVISSVDPGVVYLSFIDVKLNYMRHTGKLRGVHVLGVDMNSHRVVSAFKGPPHGHLGVIPFNFSSNKNKLKKVHRIRGMRRLPGRVLRRMALSNLRIQYTQDDCNPDDYDWEEVDNKGDLYVGRPSREEGEDLCGCSSGEKRVADKSKSQIIPLLIPPTPYTRLRDCCGKIGLQCVLD